MWRVRNNARGGLLRDRRGEGGQGVIRRVTKSLELGRVRRGCNGGMAMVLRQRQRRILGSRLRIARLLGRRRDVTLVYYPEQIKTSAGQICSDRCVLIATKK